MKTIKFKVRCSFKGKEYDVGNYLENITIDDLSDIWKLNEKGIIESMSEDDFNKIYEELKKTKDAKPENKEKKVNSNE